jgi:hypothetical protein
MPPTTIALPFWDLDGLEFGMRDGGYGRLDCGIIQSVVEMMYEVRSELTLDKSTGLDALRRSRSGGCLSEGSRSAPPGLSSALPFLQLFDDSFQSLF